MGQCGLRKAAQNIFAAAQRSAFCRGDERASHGQGKQSGEETAKH
jgi:hypothetical protein